MSYKNPTVHRPSAAYNAARDTYGTLTRTQRDRVLDKVSEKTNAQQGAEAEQAFVDAVNEVLHEAASFMYGYIPFGP